LDNDPAADEEERRKNARASVSGPSKLERERRLEVEIGVLVRRVAEGAGIPHPWTEAESGDT
jgi:hypothetical protein